MNKMRINKEIETRKEPNRNPEAEEYNDWTANSLKQLNRLEHAEERINELKDRSSEIT